jgi:hypothetical protein
VSQMSGGYSTRNKAEREFSYQSTTTLRVHPLNVSVYGAPELDSNFVKSVEDFGILEPILIARLSFDGDNYADYVLSGHRRFAAAQKLGLKKVPVREWSLSEGLRDTVALLTAEAHVIEANRQRIKTESQKDAEAAALLRIERELAAERQRQGGKNKVPMNSEEPSEAAERVAKQTGESADTVRKRAEIHEAKVAPAERNQQSTNKAFENLPKETLCDICQQTFPSKSAMKAHRNTEHAAEMDARWHPKQGHTDKPLVDIQDYLSNFNMGGEPYSGKPEFDLTGKTIRGDLLVHHWFTYAPRDSSLVWLVENLKKNEVDLWRTCDLRLYERTGDKKNKRTHGIFGVGIWHLLVNGKPDYVSTQEIFEMWLEKARERLAQIKSSMRSPVVAAGSTPSTPLQIPDVGPETPAEPVKELGDDAMFPTFEAQKMEMLKALKDPELAKKYFGAMSTPTSVTPSDIKGDTRNLSMALQRVKFSANKAQALCYEAQSTHEREEILKILNDYDAAFFEIAQIATALMTIIYQERHPKAERTPRYQAFIDEFPKVSMLGANGRVNGAFRDGHPDTADYPNEVLDVWMSNKKWRFKGMAS